MLKHLVLSNKTIGHTCVQTPGFVQQNNWSHMCSNTWFCPTKQFIRHVFKHLVLSNKTIGHTCVQTPGFVQQNNWSHMCSNTWFCPTKQLVTHVFKQESFFFFLLYFKEALATILTKKLYVLEIGK